MTLQVHKLYPERWDELSEGAHCAVFDKFKPVEKERIDFALVVTNGGLDLCGYVTIKENDADSVYWQFAGAFPGTRDTFRAFPVSKAAFTWCQERYSRIFCSIENVNQQGLKMAMRLGFLITGTRTIKGRLYVEHSWEKEIAHV